MPDNYVRVWGDGRLNPNRGLPETVGYATQPVPAPVATQPRVSTRSTPPAVQQPRASDQISGHRYVQVATFSNRANAQAVAQSLRNQGLPMRIGVLTRNGQELRLVLAGPFSSDRQLQNALGTARAAGFSDAFTRQ